LHINYINQREKVWVCLLVTSLPVNVTEPSRHVFFYDLPFRHHFYKQPSLWHTLSYNINAHLHCPDWGCNENGI